METSTIGALAPFCMRHYHVVFFLGFSLVVAACFPVQPEQRSDTTSSTSISSPSPGSSPFIESGSASSSPSQGTLSSRSSVPVISSSAASSSQPASVAASRGVYTLFHDGVIGSERAVLFFHAPWCPYCRSADTFLQDLYQENAPRVSVYKIDYDSQTALKQQYGVVTQHTFVLIDSSGKEITSLIGPSNEKLQQFLQ